MDSKSINSRKNIFIAFGLFVIIVLLWSTPVVYPVKLFTVLLHELSHGLAAIISGGEMVRIEISPMIGGVCYTRGGWRFLVLSAGYLGSMLWGCLILYLAARTRLDKSISMILGAALAIIALLYIRNTFGFIFTLGFALAIFLIGWKASENINDILLKFLGMTSALYAIIDIKQDIISRTVPGSDAYKLAEMYLLPPIFWGLLWILLAVVVTYFTLKSSFTTK